MSDLKFAPSRSSRSPDNDAEPWPVLVVDDEATVHLITDLVLKDLVFEDRPVRLIRALSGTEALDVHEREPEIAVILLDVVMEDLNTGLDVVQEIRDVRDDRDVRIILRTGQAGTESPGQIIKRYEVNGLETKEDMSGQRLRNQVFLALRSYRDIRRARSGG